MGAHVGFGGSSAHIADNVPCIDLLPLADGRVAAEGAIIGDIAAAVGDGDGGAHQFILRDGLNGAPCRRFHRIPIGGLDVQPLMGAPIPHSFVIEELVHTEYGDGGAVQGGDHLGQQLCGLFHHGLNLYGLVFNNGDGRGQGLNNGCRVLHLFIVDDLFCGRFTPQRQGAHGDSRYEAQRQRDVKAASFVCKKSHSTSPFNSCWSKKMTSAVLLWTDRGDFIRLLEFFAVFLVPLAL